MSFIFMWKSCTSEKDKGISEYHFHDHCELLFLTEGSIKMNISGKNYLMEPEQMVVISHLEPHDLNPVSYPYSRIGIHIDSKKLHEFGIPPRLLSVLFYRSDNFNHIFDLKGSTQAVWMINQLYEEFRSLKNNANEMINVYFYSLLLHLQRQNGLAFCSNDVCKNPEMEDARRFIDLHFSEKLKIKELAEKYFLSQSYFISLFKQYTGYTPKKYLTLCRIAQARKLLIGTDFSIKEISDRTGYESSNDFVRSFRESMGIAPGIFRSKFEKKSVLIYDEQDTK